MITVLYVDDEPLLLELGKLFLERGGQFAVDTVTSAPAALGLLGQRRYDAVISDYQMPVMDGIEFLKKVRAVGSTVPFIIFTGRGREEIVIQALNEGADFYLQKGGEPESQFAELAHKIRSAVQQRRAETAIRDHERREADIINFLPDATFAIDTGGVVIAWNRAMEKMTGIGAGEILGKGNFQYALPFYHERRPILIDLVLKEDPAAASKYPFIGRDGKTLYSEITIPHFNRGRGATLWFTASPLYNTVGTIIGAIESIREITERRRAEEELIAANQEYMNLLSQMQDVYYRSDANGRLVRASQSWATLLGYGDISECIGRSIADDFYMNPADRKEFLDHIYRDGKVAGYEVLLRRKDGSPVLVSTSSHAIAGPGGTVIGVEGTFRDITRQKQVEEALQASEARYRNIFDQTVIGIFRVTSGGAFLEVNPAFARMFGYDSPAEMTAAVSDIGRQIIIRPEDRRRITEAFAHGGQLKDCIVECFHRAGSRIWIRIHASAMRNGAGRILYYEGTAEDVTARRRQDQILSAQLSLGLLLQATRGMKATLDACLDAAIAIAELDAGGIYLVDEQTGSLNLAVFRNLTEEFAAAVAEYPSGSVNAQMVMEKKPFYLPYRRTGLVQTSVQEREGLHMLAVIPIVSAGRVIACLNLASHTQDLVSESSRVALETLATQIGAAIDRIRADEALAWSERNYRIVVENQTEFISRFRPDGTHVFVNDAYCRYFGLSRDEILGHRFWPSIPPPDRGRVREFFASLTPENPVGSIEHRIVLPDGTVRWQRWNDRAVFDPSGTLIEYQSVGRDTTALKEAELALRESGERYKALFDQSPVAIWEEDFSKVREFFDDLRRRGVTDIRAHFMKNPEDLAMCASRVRILAANRSSLRFFGAGDLSGLSRNLTEYFTEESLPVFLEELAALASGRTEFAAEVPVRTLQGEQRIVNLYLAVVPSHEGLLDRILVSFVDITAQKAMEASLCESGERYRNFIANAGEGIFRIDFPQPVRIDQPCDDLVRDIADHAIVAEVNAALASMYGLQPPEMIGHPVREFAPDCGNQMADLTRTQGFRIIDREEQEIGPGGEPLFIVKSYFGVVEGGFLRRVWGVQRDITGRKKAETALCASELKYRTIVETSGEWIWEISLAGCTTFSNAAVTSLLGYRAEEILALPPVDLVHPEDWPAFERIFSEAVQKRQGWHGQVIRWRHRDGTYRFLESNAAPVFNDRGDLTGFQGADRDITGRVMAERALRESEARFGNLIELAQEGIWIVDPDGNTAYVNPKMAAMLGYTVEEMAGSPMSRFMDEKGRQIAARNYPAYRNGVQEQVEFEFLRKNGTLITTLVSNTSLFDTAGKFTGALAMITDITERKRVERDLTAAYREYQALLDNIQDAYYRTDESGRLIRVSRSMPAVFGYDDIIDLLGKDIAETFYFNPADREPVLREIASKGSITGYEIRLKRKDGSEVWISVNSHFWHTPDGTVGGVEGTFRDITEQKRVAGALRRKTEELDYQNRVTGTILDTVPIGILMVEAPSGKPILANREAALLLGTGEIPDATEETSTAVFKVSRAGTPSGYPWEEMPVFRAMHGESSHVDDVFLERPDGTSIWLEVFGSPVPDSRGRIAASLACFLDITGRKQAEEALRVAQEKFAKAFLSAPDAISISELDSGRFIEVNDAAVALFGWPREELIGKSAAERGIWLDKGDRAALIDQLEKQGRVERFEVRERRKDGTVYDASINADTLMIGGKRHLIAVIRDISERKKAEETIRNLAQFPSENPCPVLRVAADGTLLFANLPGQEWLASFPGGGRQHVPEAVRTLVPDALGKGGPFTSELLDGTGRAFLVFAIRPPGEPYVNLYVTDISGLKRAERTLAEANRKLRLLSSITRHDIINQIAILRGFAQIALMKGPETTVADLLEKIDETGATIARQIEFTRTYQELGIHAPGWYRVSRILAGQSHGGLAVTCTCDAEVFADPMLDKVFFNLLENAVRHGEHATAVAITCGKGPGGLAITVADNGAGVPPNLKEKIFEKGYGKHTGFGLFLVREILAITGITIQEDGVYGEGGRFVLTVPEGGYRFAAD